MKSRAENPPSFFPPPKPTPGSAPETNDEFPAAQDMDCRELVPSCVCSLRTHDVIVLPNMTLVDSFFQLAFLHFVHFLHFLHFVNMDARVVGMSGADLGRRIPLLGHLLENLGQLLNSLLADLVVRNDAVAR